jgi:hypothetical protein
MRRALFVAAVLGLTLPPQAPAEVNVSANGTRVTVTARQAPLNEVLQQIARNTGMKLEFEGTPPRTPLTLSIVDEPLVTAVGRILEGAGVDFAFTLDPTEQKVVKLLLMGRSPTSAVAGRNAPRAVIRQMEDPVEDEAPGDVDPAILEPAPDEFQTPELPPDTTPPSVPLIPGVIPGAGAPSIPGSPSTGPTPLPEATPKLPTYQPFPQTTPPPVAPAPVPRPTPTPTSNQQP